MRAMRSVAAAVVTGLCALAALPATAQVTVLTAHRIDTMDASRPRAEAMAYDASGAILRLGDAEELLAAYPGANRLDLGDATVVPGLIDAHVHLTGDPGTPFWRGAIDSNELATIVGVKNALLTARAGFTTVRDVGVGGARPLCRQGPAEDLRGRERGGN